MMAGPWGELPAVWPCEAYGHVGLEHGHLCWLAVEGRLCPTRAGCHAVMKRERKRVFDVILEQAAAGDFTSQYLAEHLGGPDDILGGDQPIGPWCPWCGEPPRFILPGQGDAFCGNESCGMLKWDPTKTYPQMLEAGISMVELERKNGT